MLIQPLIEPSLNLEFEERTAMEEAIYAFGGQPSPKALKASEAGQCAWLAQQLQEIDSEEQVEDFEARLKMSRQIRMLQYQRDSELLEDRLQKMKASLPCGLPPGMPPAASSPSRVVTSLRDGSPTLRYDTNYERVARKYDANYESEAMRYNPNYESATYSPIRRSQPASIKLDSRSPGVASGQLSRI